MLVVEEGGELGKCFCSMTDVDFVVFGHLSKGFVVSLGLENRVSAKSSMVTR